jgi:hypothetical protein
MPTANARRKKTGGGAYYVLFPLKRANTAAFCLCDRAAGPPRGPRGATGYAWAPGWLLVLLHGTQQPSAQPLSAAPVASRPLAGHARGYSTSPSHPRPRAPPPPGPQAPATPFALRSGGHPRFPGAHGSCHTVPPSPLLGLVNYEVNEQTKKNQRDDDEDPIPAANTEMHGISVRRACSDSSSSSLTFATFGASSSQRQSPVLSSSPQ